MRKLNAKLSSKAGIIALIAVVILLSTAGVTIAGLSDFDGPITNIFKKSYVQSEVVETLENEVKKNVMIKNTGDTQAYIRATVIVTWKDASGNVYSSMPVAGTDYNITYNLSSSGWMNASDGYYYYKKPVDPGNTTGKLITSCSPVSGRAPEGFSLSVEILGSAIQSTPTHVVVDNWTTGVTGVSGTTLVLR